MLFRFTNWLDHRTGYRRALSVLLIEHIPGGAKWRYVWGSCLAFVFLVQLITGVLLMTAYSPGDSTAWASVHYIQYEMDFGWFIRGLHHFGSQTMVVLLGLHMLQVVIAGAHLPPREINWWLGLVLLGLVLALSLTGYLLPWDQKGYYATKVATNIAGNVPAVGPWLQKVIVGGPEYGNHTLTRFYTLHVGILPPLVILFTVLHMTVFRRHGVTAPKGANGEGWFWPDQAFRDLLVCLLIFGIMIGLVVYGHGHKVETPAEPEGETSLYEKWVHAGRDGRGANLDAPADVETKGYPARPEWYFLFLFQLLKYFPGEQEVIGTVVIPGAVMLALAVLPLLGYGRMRPFGHVVGVVVVSALLLAAAALTFLAIREDRANSELQKKMEAAARLGHQAVNLAREGVPKEGGVYLLRRDPLTRGPELFKKHCATCHTYGDEMRPETPTASDLKGFGSEEWTLRLLTNPGHPDFFGRTGLTEMQEAIATYFPDVGKTPAEQAKLDDESKKLLEEDRTHLKAIARWLASHPRADSEHKDKEWFRQGLDLFSKRDCATCHVYESKGGKAGPDLTGYGDADWMRLMIMAPYHRSRYKDKNAMPAFRDLEGVTGELAQLDVNDSKQAMLATGKVKGEQVEKAHQLVHLSDVDRELIIRWLLGDHRVVFGGDPIAGPPKRPAAKPAE